MLKQLKKAVCQANLDLVTYRLVTMTWGNVSGYDPDKQLVVIKPSGVSYDKLKPEDMVVVDLNGNVIEGDLKPSSDTPTHVLLYRQFAQYGIRGITHTHSFNATMFAQARLPIPCLGTTHADHFMGSVPVTRALTPDEVQQAYEHNTGQVILDCFADKNPAEIPGVLVAGHAPFAWGKSPADSVKNAVALEAVAQLVIGTNQVLPNAPLLEDYVLDKHYQRKHGPNATYGQDTPSTSSTPNITFKTPQDKQTNPHTGLAPTINFANHEIWFITGSQHLYGPETLAQVDRDSQAIVDGLNRDANLPIKIVFKPVLKTADEISNALRDADASPNCIGLITWMHTFSPAKMWINGLSKLSKPFCHLHTQFNRDIPWSAIDMDFMNLNQSAHGGREFGFICSRLRKRRKVITGHWQNKSVHTKLDTWMRAAAAWHDSKQMKIARIGDNMRQVAVTEGDKVEAQLKFGYEVNGYGVGDLTKFIDAVTEQQIDQLCTEYGDLYRLAPNVVFGGDKHQSLRDAAKIEIGLRAFLQDGNFTGYTDTFENLTGMKQLPGIASQRLMADGYGFGAEGDWKHAALVRTMKVMAHGLEGGTSFMEDYTYHFDPSCPSVLGSHMLEICPTIADARPTVEVHALGIGGKEDPARLVFNSQTGPAINATIVDMGNRFRMVVNNVDVVEPLEDLPKLPVARALWMPQPSLEIAASAWIQAGGAHHTGYSLALTTEHMEDFADMAELEYLVIDEDTSMREFKNEIRWNDAAYGVAGMRI